MPRRIRGKAPRKRTFLKQWREYRKLTLEQAAARLDDMSGAQLSRIENGLSPYTQDFLELAAYAYRTDVPSLLMRDPSDPEGIWSIWDNAAPGERRTIVEHARITVRKTGS